MRLKEKMNELRNERKDLINEIKERTFYAAFNYCTSGNSLHEDDLQEHANYHEELYNRIADHKSAIFDVEMKLNYEYENNPPEN